MVTMALLFDTMLTPFLECQIIMLCLYARTLTEMEAVFHKIEIIQLRSIIYCIQ